MRGASTHFLEPKGGPTFFISWRFSAFLVFHFNLLNCDFVLHDKRKQCKNYLMANRTEISPWFE